MPTCASCGQQFFFETLAWGDQTCGVCIGARIELSLMGGLPARNRRPMRRADSLHAVREGQLDDDKDINSLPGAAAA